MAAINSSATFVATSQLAARAAIGPNAYGIFQIGGVVFPLRAAGVAASPVSGTNGPLAIADPSVFYALDYYPWMLGTYIGDLFTSMCTALKFCTTDGNVIANSVNTQLAVDPAEYLTKAQMPLPLFAIWREKGTSRKYRSVIKMKEVTTLRAIWVLPPMTVVQAKAFEPLLKAASLVMDHATEAGWDPAYTPPGSTLGKQAWALAGFDMLEVVGVAYGKLPGWTQDMWLPSVSWEIQLTESGTKYPAAPVFGGVSAAFGIYDTVTQTVLEDLIEQDTWVPIPVPGGAPTRP